MLRHNSRSEQGVLRTTYRGVTGSHAALPGTWLDSFPSGQKGVLAERNTTTSHHTTNFTQRFMGREKTRKVAVSAWRRNSREGWLYVGFLMERRRLFRVNLSRVGIDGISNPELGLFTVENGDRVQPLEQSVFCGWKQAIGGPQEKGLALRGSHQGEKLLLLETALLPDQFLVQQGE